MTITRPSKPFAVLAVAAAVLASPPAVADDPTFAVGTAFVYRGSLEHDGRPAEGLYDLSFELFDAARDGTTFGRIDLFDVPIEDGAFEVELDFRRPVHSGEPLWLETQVRAAGTGAYATLAPRERLAGASTSTCAVDADVTITGTLDVEPVGSEVGLSVDCCYEADLDQGGQITLDGFLGILRIDNDEIQAVTLNQPDQFQINPHGGNVGLGISNPAAPVHVPGAPDVTPGGGGALVVGLSTNVAIDDNEIMARSGGGVSTLYLNNDGGLVRTGGDLTVAGVLGIGVERVEVSANSRFVDAVCPAGKAILTGGCVGAVVLRSVPASSTTWSCAFEDDANNRAVAVCARVAW